LTMFVVVGKGMRPVDDFTAAISPDHRFPWGLLSTFS